MHGNNSLREHLLQELATLQAKLRRDAPPDPNKQTKKHYGIVSQTLNGELVRSRAEKHIADYFFHHKVRYVYEPSLKLGRHLVRPDFYLPEQGVYIEYWGLVSNADYVRTMIWKLKLYQRFKINLVSLYEYDLFDIPNRVPLH